MAKAQPQLRQKHVPQRTCVSCGKVRPKWELVRIVRTPASLIEIDLRGKKGGRGVYLCKEQRCWETGLVKKRLQRALKTEITAEQLSALWQYGKSFFSTER